MYKLQFIHKLTASDTSKTAKITKRWYYSAAHWHLGDVLVGNHLIVKIAAKEHQRANWILRTFV